MSATTEYWLSDRAEPTTVPRALELRLTAGHASRSLASMRREAAATDVDREAFGRAASVLRSSIEDMTGINESPTNRHQPDILMLRADALGGAGLRDIRSELLHAADLLDHLAEGQDLKDHDLDHLDDLLLTLRTVLAKGSRRAPGDLAADL